jgi:competence protein ComEC
MTLAERIHLYPMLQLAVVLIIGIIVGDVWGSGLPAVGWMIACVVVIVVTIIVGSRHNLVQSMLILLAVMMLGIWITVLKEQHEKVALSLRPMDYKAVVISEPTEHGKIVRCDLLLTTGPLSGRSIRASILKDTVEKRFSQLHVGDGIEAWSVMEKPRNFYSDSNFDYVRWMQIHGFVAQTFIFYANWRKANVNLRQTSRLERVKLVAMEFRNRLLKQYQKTGITGQSYAVIAAMTLGEKSRLSAATKDVCSLSVVARIYWHFPDYI